FPRFCILQREQVHQRGIDNFVFEILYRNRKCNWGTRGGFFGLSQEDHVVCSDLEWLGGTGQSSGNGSAVFVFLGNSRRIRVRRVVHYNTEGQPPVIISWIPQGGSDHFPRFCILQREQVHR